MLYRGTWKPHGYFKGDVVTFGGSSWVALVDTDAKPETCADWQLATKRGQHGKDGKDGRNGERGPAGRDGKNHWET
jgi:integrin beta 3